MYVKCLVCLDDINLFDKKVSILNCGHFFHNNCLKDWLDRQMNCPECRSVVNREHYVRNIFPNINDEILSHRKSLINRSGELKKEKFFLQIENTSLKES